ncbi:thioesterase family protein [Pseudalkalibacillus sp. SCS-8]|uniref:thioesterase family protein n=1 Tax=Pseudalkalibacillus nanhaiensis TaxID=3115291 RepID=UPI0032D9B9D4
MSTFQFEQCVRKEWVDYNGHMNDAEYAKVFSLAVDHFIEQIGLDVEGRESLQYTIFTLETHVCYLKEAHEAEKLTITNQLLDLDEKRIHLFFTMKNEHGEVISTSEQMLMGIDTNAGRPAPFPEGVASVLDKLYSKDRDEEMPKQAGRTIGIKRKS